MTSSALTRPGERERISVKLGQLDWRVIGLLTFLSGVGTLMLYSLGKLSWEPWAAKHLIRYSALLVALIVMAMIHPKWWFRSAYPLYGVLLFMVALVDFTPLGYVAGGAKNWLNLGIIRIQPAEFMKIGLVLALARWYHGHTAQEARWSWKLLIPAAMIGVPFVLVAAQPDLGSAMIIGLTGAAMMVIAGLSWRAIGAAVAAAVAVIPPFVMFVMHDYQRNRVLNFLNPEMDPTGTGYNIIQSKIAVGSGGLLGKGFGLGSQSQLEFLPERHTATSGMTAFFALFVLINGAMVIGLAPVVGVPMPLLSYGGSSMMTVMIGFGLIMSVRVHRYAELPKGAGLF